MSRNETTRHTFPPTANNGNDFCTIGALLDNREQFALPHFQRGSVWHDDAKSKLLESLALNTPCGSIILWVPESFEIDKERHGTLVKDWSNSNWDSVNYLVVDGQQRLTNLSQILRTSEKDEWALNIVKIPSLREEFSQIDVSSFLQKKNLFTKLNSQKDIDTNSTYKTTYENRMKLLMPLNDIISDNYEIIEQTALGCLYIRNEDSNILYVHTGIKGVVQEFLKEIKAIESRILQVIVKDNTNSLVDIIELYNRINSSGVVVREEERAFASLMKTEEMEHDWLKKLFEEIHGKQNPNRDEILQRQREKNFGFKLIIRTIGQVVAYHMNEKRYDLSRLDGYIDRIEKYHSQDFRAHWNTIFEDTERILTTTARILKETLKCDDFRFLPTAQGLKPVFALLLRFAKVPNFAVVKAILTCQLPESLFESKPSFDDVVEQIRQSQDFESAMKAFPEIQIKKLAESIKGARSVQHPWVSILYWMQRELHAKDYVNQQSIKDGNSCQIEHIIPFSYLKVAYKEDNLQQKDRNRSHDANAIGNLTFLTRSGNLEHMNKLISLQNSDSDEMLKHQLNTVSLKKYEDIFKIIEIKKKAITRKNYEDFIDERLKELTVQFEGWLNKHLQVSVQTDVKINYSSIVRSLPAIISKLHKEANWSDGMVEQYKILLSQYRRKSGYDFVVFNDNVNRTRATNTIRVKRLYTYKEGGVKEAVLPQIMLGVNVLNVHFTDLKKFISESISEISLDKYSSIDFHLTKGESKSVVEDSNKKNNSLTFNAGGKEIETNYSGKGYFELDYENSILFVSYINEALNAMI